MNAIFTRTSGGPVFDSARRKAALVVPLATTSLLLGPFATAGATAVPSPDVVISEVYGGGGNSGATFTHDFIALYNRGADPVDLSGWSVQYASSSGTTYQLTELSGSIGAGEHYLVQRTPAAAGRAHFPHPTQPAASRCPRQAARSHLLSGRAR